jgi:hypothetical protein
MGDESPHVVIRIRVEKATGKAVCVENENGERITDKLPCEQLETLYYSEAGFKFVGLLLYSHQSPGCLYWVNGWPIPIPCP